MPHRSPPNAPLIIAIAGLCLGLAVWLFPHRLLATEQGSATASALGAFEPAPTIPQLPDMHGTRDRPLFVPGRRLIAPGKNDVQTEEASEKATAQTLTLIGTRATGGQWSALISTEKHTSGSWFNLLDDVDGWVIEKISSRSATLSRDGEKIELRLDL